MSIPIFRFLWDLHESGANRRTLPVNSKGNLAHSASSELALNIVEGACFGGGGKIKITQQVGQQVS